MAEYKTCQKRDVIAQKYNMSILNYCDTQCTAVLYRSWSLKMGQQGTKMTLSTLTMSGDDFPGVYVWPSGAQIVFMILLAIKCSILTQCPAYDRGGRQSGRGL